MKLADERSFDELCVSDIGVMSGVRYAGRTTDNRNYPRPYHALLYIWNGEAKFWHNGKQVARIQNGGLVYIPKGTKYKMQYTQDNTTFVLVNFKIFDKNGEDMTLFDRISVVGQDDDSRRIASVMSKFELVGSSAVPSAALRRKELMYRLLLLVLEQSFPIFTEQQRYPQIFNGVLLLKQTYLENIPIEEFAKACNISISSFRELFKKQYGMSPLQYRNFLRISRAKELLSEGSCTVNEATFASGFDNVGYFCRSYKKIVGETPTETKRKIPHTE